MTARATRPLAGLSARLEGLHLSLPAQLAIAVAILVLVWPISSEGTLAPLDLSWQLGLHQAAQDGLRFGHDIVFTYGPLGFLSRPSPFIGPTSAMAFVATAAIYLALVGLLFQAALRHLPAWAAVLLAVVFARAIAWLEPFEALQILAFGLGVHVLGREEAPRGWIVAAIAGLLASVAMLGKANDGVFVTAMGFVVILAVARPRALGLVVYAAVTALSSIGLWLAAGQQLPDLVPFLRATEEIIAGYSDAMAVTPANAALVYAAFALVAIVVIACAVRTSSGWSRGRRLALAAMVVLLLFACWKFAFVRSHIAQTFVMLGFATFFLLPITLRGAWKVAVLATVAIALAVSARPPIETYAAVPTSAVEFVRQAGTVASPWSWDQATTTTRDRLQSIFPVPASILAMLRGHTVSIDPDAAAIVTAYPGIDWRPLPVFQMYSAYTTGLDQMNADVLRSAARPEFILRRDRGHATVGDRTVAPAVDGRNYWFESPEATIERLCRYREVATDGNYQALADTGQGCAEAVPLATVTARVGETVTVPAAPSPDDLVFVRVHGVGTGPLSRLRAALWSTPAWSVLVAGHRYRLVPGTAGDGLVLAVPAAAQGSPPFAFGPPVRTIAIRGPRLPGDGKLTYEFMTAGLPEGAGQGAAAPHP